MSYGHDGEMDSFREYEMIYTLFQGAEDEEERRRQNAGEEAPCECPPEEDGIAVKVLKFLFGDGDIEEDDCDRRRPYHRHIQQPAHPSHTSNIGSKKSGEYKRWARKRLPQYAQLSGDTQMPGPTGHVLKAESLLRLIATVLCAAAVIVFSSTLRHVVRLKDWFMTGS